MQWTDRIGRRVKLRDIHGLLAVAQSGSMARAAELLAISQPVVSKTIADLEHALGVRLLDRTAQGVEPTAYGLSFIQCGTVVFDELRRGVQEIEFFGLPANYYKDYARRVTSVTPEKAQEAAATYVSKDDLFRQADFISIHVVLSQRSRGLVGAKEFGLMKPTAYIINTSRGPIIDEAAMLAVLRDKKIAGAGLDVFDVEPLPLDHPLRKMDNVPTYIGVEESSRW